MITPCGTPCGLPLSPVSRVLQGCVDFLFTTLSFDFLRACQMVDHGLRQALEQSLSQRTILGGPLLKNHPAYRICNSSSDSRLLKTLKKLSVPKGDVLLPSRAAETMFCWQRLSESRLDRHFQAFATSDTNSTRRSAAVCFSPRGPPAYHPVWLHRCTASRLGRQRSRSPNKIQHHGYGIFETFTTSETCMSRYEPLWLSVG